MILSQSSQRARYFTSRSKVITRAHLPTPLHWSASLTQPVFSVGPSKTFLIVVPGAVEVKLLGLVLAVQKHRPSSAVRLHVAPHLHRPSTRTPAEQERCGNMIRCILAILTRSLVRPFASEGHFHSRDSIKGSKVLYVYQPYYLKCGKRIMWSVAPKVFH